MLLQLLPQERAVQLLRRPSHRRSYGYSSTLSKSNVNLKCVGQWAALSADGADDLNLSTLSLIFLVCSVRTCLVSLRKLNPLQENARPKF